MRAVLQTAFGGPDVLQSGEAPDPRPGKGEVLVRVRACALNRLDLWVRSGAVARPPLPHILGSDVAGEVAGGPDKGRRVVAYPGLPCGSCAACCSGSENRCERFRILGYQVNGGYAEQVALPRRNLFPAPPGLSWEEAAALPLVFTTVHHALVARARLRAGETLLVWAAGSGVGSAAVQLGKHLKARVIATAGSEAKLKKAERLGADEAINHREADVAAGVQRLTGGRGADVVLEHVGAETWPSSLRAMARGGRMVSFGVTTGGTGSVEIRTLYQRHLSILGTYLGTRRDLAAVLRLAGRRVLKPVVDSTFPLERAAEAHRKMERGEHFGKIVLKV
ncbi:MAG: zinc-binding dehydrogenase [Halobacteria archaeon]